MAVGGASDRGRRGQSSPIALVLIFGLVIGATTVVLLVGGLAITDTQDQLNAQSAEKAMTQLDSKASLVALGQSQRQMVEFGTSEDGDYRLDEDAGQMTITHETSSGPPKRYWKRISVRSTTRAAAPRSRIRAAASGGPTATGTR
ncbi:hypothetical protein ACFQER_14555 [Halomicroarcula sp. GCM10025894]|uniref:DUF7289 family protein n=1 Tax=Halomicroarcula sp. GCM10025894 TaxID=3252673 RepID=UPI003611A37B